MKAEEQATRSILFAKFAIQRHITCQMDLILIRIANTPKKRRWFSVSYAAYLIRKYLRRWPLA